MAELKLNALHARVFYAFPPLLNLLPSKKQEKGKRLCYICLQVFNTHQQKVTTDIGKTLHECPLRTGYGIWSLECEQLRRDRKNWIKKRKRKKKGKDKMKTRKSRLWKQPKNPLDVGGRWVVNKCKNKSKHKSIRDRYAHRGMKMTADRQLVSSKKDESHQREGKGKYLGSLLKRQAASATIFEDLLLLYMWKLTGNIHAFLLHTLINVGCIP